MPLKLHKNIAIQEFGKYRAQFGVVNRYLTEWVVSSTVEQAIAQLNMEAIAARHGQLSCKCGGKNA